MTRIKNPARDAADIAPDAASAPVTAHTGDSPAAAVLAALAANPGGATVAAIAGHTGITVAAARQVLAEREKAGTATRVKGGRPGIPDTWKAAVGDVGPGRAVEPGAQPGVPGTGSVAPHDEAPPAHDAGEPAAEGLDATADAVQPGPAGREAGAAAPGPDPAVTAKATANALAIAQAAEAARKALAAGDLPAALAALDTAQEQAAQARRVMKAAASGRRASATRPGGLRDLVEQHLRNFPDASFTSYQIGKVLTRSSGAVANALDKLVSLGVAELASGRPRSYRLAPADPGTSAEATASAA